MAKYTKIKVIYVGGSNDFVKELDKAIQTEVNGGWQIVAMTERPPHEYTIVFGK